MHHRSSPERAIVYVPPTADPTEFAEHAGPCLERVDAAAYTFIGIVRSISEAYEMLRDGRAHVLIVADSAHLPPDRQPRVEVADAPILPRPAESGCVVPPEVTAPRSQVRRPRRVSR